MTEPVKIPVQIKYDGSGFKQLSRDAQQAQREALAATRQQITARRNLVRLTAGLDRDLAGRPSGAGQLAGGFGISTGALTGAAVGAGGAMAARATIDTARESIDLAREQAAVDAQLAAVLKSTGHAAGMTSFELKEMASQLQKVTNFGDETIQRGQNLLLTFTNIGRDVFPDATRAMLDMSVAMDQDVKQSAVQLGKALNDPIEGVSALRRVGVQFSDSQEQMIQKMVRSGDILGAQRMILAELKKEFGGSAEAARAADGGFQALNNAVGDLKEEIGQGLMPVMSAFNDVAIPVIETLTGLVDGYNKTSKAVSDLHKEHMAAAPAWAQTVESISKTALWLNPMVAITDKLINVGSQAAFNQEALAEQIDETAAREAEAAAAAAGLAAAQAAAALAAKTEADAQKRLEEELKRLERARQTQVDTLLSIKDIEKRAADDSGQAWQDWSEGVSKLNSDTWKNIERAQERSAKTQREIQRNLTRDLARTDQDLAKDLEKLRQANAKRDRRAAEDDARQEKRERRMAQVDAVADERLFQFELRQMGAEGDAIGIQQALERRAIEEEIAREKSATEAQIEDEDRRVQQQRQREDDAERVQEMRAAAAERKAEIEAAAEEAAAAERAALRETIAAENESYRERRAALDSANDERQAAIESGSQEAIQALAEELVRAGELTEEELGKLTTAAGRIGKEVGTAFAYGIRKGTRDVAEAEGFLGLFGGGDGAAAAGGSRGSANQAMMQRDMPGFALGGVVPGPIGAPTLAVVHGGEKITPPGQAGDGVYIDLRGASFGSGIREDELMGWFRDFAREFVKPALRR